MGGGTRAFEDAMPAPAKTAVEFIREQSELTKTWLNVEAKRKEIEDMARDLDHQERQLQSKRATLSTKRAEMQTIENTFIEQFNTAHAHMNYAMQMKRKGDA